MTFVRWRLEFLSIVLDRATERMATIRLWRRRVLVAVLALGSLLVGGWLAYRGLVDPWPAKVEFRDEIPLTFTPDGRSFVFSNPGKITFRDAATGRERFSWSLPENFDTKIVVAGAFSPDGRTFAAAIRRNNTPAEVAFIDVTSGQIRATGKASHPQIGELSFTADGTALRLGAADTPGFREVVSFDPATGATEFVFPPAPPGPARGAALLPDGRFLVYLDSQGGSISLHEVGPAASRPAPDRIGLSSAGASGAISCGRDGRTLAVGRLDGTIDLWDIPGRRLIKTLPAQARGYAMWVVFSPDGRTLAAEYGNAPKLEWLQPLRTIYYSIIGGRMKAGSSDLVILDLATGKPLVRSATSYWLFYSPDGRKVVTKDDDGRTRLRDVPEP